MPEVPVGVADEPLHQSPKATASSAATTHSGRAPDVRASELHAVSSQVVFIPASLPCHSRYGDAPAARSKGWFGLTFPTRGYAVIT